MAPKTYTNVTTVADTLSKQYWDNLPWASTLPEIADWPELWRIGLIPGLGAPKTERPGEIAGPQEGTELSGKWLAQNCSLTAN